MADALLGEIERVYRSEYNRYLRVARALLRSDDGAVDAVQEAFATAVQKRRKFRREGPLEAWLWRIVVNTALKERTKSRPLPHLARTHEEADPPSPVTEAVSRLPERQRLVLFLRYYADLDYGAIATALDISRGTVGATLNAAHTSLRRMLHEVRP